MTRTRPPCLLTPLKTTSLADLGAINGELTEALLGSRYSEKRGPFPSPSSRKRRTESVTGGEGDDSGRKAGKPNRIEGLQRPIAAPPWWRPVPSQDLAGSTPDLTGITSITISEIVKNP